MLAGLRVQLAAAIQPGAVAATVQPGAVQATVHPRAVQATVEQGAVQATVHPRAAVIEPNAIKATVERHAVLATAQAVMEKGAVNVLIGDGPFVYVLAMFALGCGLLPSLGMLQDAVRENFLVIIVGVLLALGLRYGFQVHQSIVSELHSQLAAVRQEIVSEMTKNVPVGTILSLVGTGPIPTFLLCDGSLVEARLYPDLVFACGGTIVQGMVQLPDLQGRCLIGAGHSAGLSDRKLGSTGGDEIHRLTVQEMPPHEHTGGWLWYDQTVTGNCPGTCLPVFYNPKPRSTDSCGGNQPHNNMQPWYALNFFIKVS